MKVDGKVVLSDAAGTKEPHYLLTTALITVHIVWLILVNFYVYSS